MFSNNSTNLLKYQNFKTLGASIKLVFKMYNNLKMYEQSSVLSKELSG